MTIAPTVTAISTIPHEYQPHVGNAVSRRYCDGGVSPQTDVKDIQAQPCHPVFNEPAYHQQLCGNAENKGQNVQFGFALAHAQDNLGKKRARQYQAEQHGKSYCQIWCMAFRPLSLLIARLPACHL